MYENDVFDAAVFGTMLAPRRAAASQGELSPADRQRTDLDSLIHESMLNFSSLMAMDKTARIDNLDQGYRVEFGNMRVAFDFKNMMEQDNQGVDLAFSDELAGYQPEEGLVRKSKVPLWVLRPMGNKVMVIQRIW